MKFIDDRLSMVTGQLDSVERNIAKFQSKESVVDLGTQASAYFGKVTDLDKANSQIDLQMEALNDINAYVKSKAQTPGTVPSLILLTDPTLSGLLDKLYTAETQAKQLNSVTGEQNDAVVLANAEVARIKQDIVENMSNIKQNLLAEKRQIDSKIAENNSLLALVPEKQRVFMDISRQQAIKNNIYTYLLQKREETAISSASATPDLRVVESPTAYGPVRPIGKNFLPRGPGNRLAFRRFHRASERNVQPQSIVPFGN